jgi:hypothetical protein
MCVYLTMLEPSFKTNDIARAERVVALYLSVRSALVMMPTNASDMLVNSHVQNKKSLHFYRASSPDPSAAKRKNKWKGFLVLRRHFVSKKFRSNLHLLENFSLHFSSAYGDPRLPAIRVWW